MYPCPACGAGLRFDIASQLLHCDYCDNDYSPDDYDKDKNARERRDGYLDVTVYTCTQCGAEMVSTDNAATGFCSYCGASAVLASRMDSQPRPKKILPFLKTKEDCKKAYAAKAKYAIYAPKELRDAAFLERFRGIYIPYWLYRVTFKETLSIPAKASYQKGNYHYTDEYNINMSLKGGYKDIAYDASLYFNDRLADVIAPFSQKKMKPFRTGYLCGFYADTADVKKETYFDEAKVIATDYALGSVQTKLAKVDITASLPTDEAGKEALVGTSCTDADGALLPVWFLTWRQKDRVAYAVVNGETGKVFADLPVDLKRFFAGSAVTAVILYILAELFLYLMPPAALSLASLTAFFAAALFFYEADKITTQEIHADDKGFWSDASPDDPGLKEYEKYRTRESKPRFRLIRKLGGFLLKLLESGIGGIFLAGFIGLNVLSSVFSFVGVFAIGFTSGTSTEAEASAAGACMLILLGGTYYFIRTLLLRKRLKTLQPRMRQAGIAEQSASPQQDPYAASGRNMPDVRPEVRMTLDALLAYGAQILALGMVLAHPVHDWVYYLGAMICLGAVTATCVGLIRRYNLLATHPVPNFFDRKGGNDSAQEY